MNYRVTWEIDIEQVKTALAAALEAHRIMLDPQSIATVFAVTSPDGTTHFLPPKILAPSPPAMGGGLKSHFHLPLPHPPIFFYVKRALERNQGHRPGVVWGRGSTFLLRGGVGGGGGG